MKKALLPLIMTALLCACAPEKECVRTGDLVFVGIPMDYSLDADSMDAAIADATGDGVLNLIHVAIAERDSEGKLWIIDATIAHGVDRHPLDTFLTDFTLKDGSYPVFKVMRLQDNALAPSWIENAKALCGQPYDTAFLPDNGALYCSELVRESYLGEEGEYLFEESPMNFLGPDGEMPVYWTQLFALLGMEVPQDVPGTNPQDMAASALLEEVAVDITQP